MMTTTEVDNWPGDVQGVQGPELMDRMRRHAERFGVEIVNDHVRQRRARPAAVPARRREGRIHLRCADHRDRRLGALPRPPSEKHSGAAACRRARPATASSSATSRSPSSAAATPPSKRRCTSRTSPRTSRSCTGATSCAPSRSCRIACSSAARPGNVAILWDHAVDEVLGNDQGVTGVRLASTARRQRSASSTSPGCSSRSATRRTRKSSRASSR